MAPVDVVLVGAGGFGRVALDAIDACNASDPSRSLNVIGIADDDPSAANLARLDARGYRHLGTISDVIEAGTCTRYVLGVGSPGAKSVIDDRFTAAGWQPVGVIHPRAVIGSMVQVGEGVIICAGVHVSTNATLGRHVHLNPNAAVGHDTTLGDYVSLNPGSFVAGEVTMGAGTLVGAGAIVLQQLLVGARSIIGAGSVVTKPVPDDVIVKGVPGAWE